MPKILVINRSMNQRFDVYLDNIPAVGEIIKHPSGPEAMYYTVKQLMYRPTSHPEVALFVEKMSDDWSA